jgi:Na+/H+ antiporter NhaC
MNDTQKGAWIMLAMALFTLAVTGYIVFSLITTKQMPENNWILPVFCFLFIVVPFFVIRKKQSPKEVQKDERDINIQRNAATVSFFLVWVLLFAFVFAAMCFFGKDGSVPVSCLPFGIVCAMLVSFVIYNIAILVQYGKAGKSNE